MAEGPKGPASVEGRAEAIAWLNARGNHAFEWDTYGQDAIGVATAVDLDGDEAGRILGKLVVVCQAGGSWEVRAVFGRPPADSFRTLRFETLGRAVVAAAGVVSG